MTVRVHKVEDCNVEARPFGGVGGVIVVDLTFTPHGHHPSQGPPPWQYRFELRSLEDIDAISNELDKAAESFTERETRHGIKSIR